MSPHPDGLVRLGDGGQIAYQIHGPEHGDPPLLLIRPLGGSMALWGSFRARLAETHRVISFDHRGCGQSSRAPPRVTTRALARDALEVLEHLRVRRANVFGISLGGMTATWLAILAKVHVAKLCLASTPARGLQLSHAGIRRELSLAAALLRPERDVEVAVVRRILSREFRAAHEEDVQRIERTVRAEPSTRAALIKHAIAGMLHDARDQLRTIRAPTLVLAGDNDQLLGVESVRALADAIPNASFDTIPSSGHDITLEQPHAAAERVSWFFR